MSSGPSLRLLVVEDDVPVARALERTLTRDGHDVLVVGTCAAARAATGPFDCAVLDVHLPDGNGVELAADLLTIATSIVFFSGSSDAPTRLAACDFGTFVPKHAGIDELVRALLDSVREAAEESLAAGAEDTPNGTSSPRLRTGKRRKPRF